MKNSELDQILKSAPVPDPAPRAVEILSQAPSGSRSPHFDSMVRNFLPLSSVGLAGHRVSHRAMLPCAGSLASLEKTSPQNAQSGVKSQCLAV